MPCRSEEPWRSNTRSPPCVRQWRTSCAHCARLACGAARGLGLAGAGGGRAQRAARMRTSLVDAARGAPAHRCVRNGRRALRPQAAIGPAEDSRAVLLYPLGVVGLQLGGSGLVLRGQRRAPRALAWGACTCLLLLLQPVVVLLRLLLLKALGGLLQRRRRRRSAAARRRTPRCRASGGAGCRHAVAEAWHAREVCPGARRAAAASRRRSCGVQFLAPVADRPTVSAPCARRRWRVRSIGGAPAGDPRAGQRRLGQLSRRETGPHPLARPASTSIPNDRSRPGVPVIAGRAQTGGHSGVPHPGGGGARWAGG